MADSFLLTKNQVRILMLVYRRPRTYQYLSKKLRISVDDVMSLLSGPMSEFLRVSLPPVASLGYGPSIVSITRDGEAYIESIIASEHARHVDTRRFWVGIILGGLLGWLLGGFGTPQELFRFFGSLFR